MNVKLIRYTADADPLAQLAAGICTRHEPTERGMQRAMDSGHESILEHSAFTFLVEGVSRVLLAQITRHRLASFSVESQRYVSYKDGLEYVIPPAITALGDEYVAKYVAQMEQMHAWYNEWAVLLGGGQAAREDARFVLPGATSTRYLVTMNGRELRHFFSLRCCNRAQWEIRSVAREMLKQVKEVAPMMFSDAGPVCVRGACPEAKPCGKQVNV